MNHFKLIILIIRNKFHEMYQRSTTKHVYIKKGNFLKYFWIILLYIFLKGVRLQTILFCLQCEAAVIEKQNFPVMKFATVLHLDRTTFNGCYNEMFVFKSNCFHISLFPRIITMFHRKCKSLLEYFIFVNLYRYNLTAPD